MVLLKETTEDAHFSNSENLTISILNYAIMLTIVGQLVLIGDTMIRLRKYNNYRSPHWTFQVLIACLMVERLA